MTIPFSRKQMLLVVIAAAAVIVGITVFLLTRSSQNKEAVMAGRETLSRMENGDPVSVDNRLAEIEVEKIRANAEVLRQELLQNEDIVWQQFTDFAILGDSRAEGFSAYEFLPYDRVMAEKGMMISYLYDDNMLHTLQMMQPTKVWLVFGNNDIGNSQNPDWLDGWIADYGEAIRRMQEVLPNSMIFVCAILPVVEPAASEPYYSAIPEVNQALAGMCAQTGAVFEDDTSLLEGHAEYYEPDGMHFSYSFYPVWATNMLLTYYDQIGGVEVARRSMEEAQANSQETAYTEAETGGEDGWSEDTGENWTEDTGEYWTEDTGEYWTEDTGEYWTEDTGEYWTDDTGNYGTDYYDAGGDFLEQAWTGE